MVSCAGYAVRINDGPNYYITYKDIFVHRIYHFDASRPNPLILDCGGNIGMSVLYFKLTYPGARIITFEPDPVVFPYLQENIARNRLDDVSVVQAGVAGKEGILSFYSDGKFSSSLSPHEAEGWARYEVPCVRLRDYLTEPVDFLKLNIEGAEYEVLADSADRLPLVREMVIEYHHLPGLPRTLHAILGLLDERGFDYLVNDFDSETNAAVDPPFYLDPETSYFLLVYAKRRG